MLVHFALGSLLIRIPVYAYAQILAIANKSHIRLILTFLEKKILLGILPMLIFLRV